MSDADSFIREVEEEVRQDRMLRYWKRYGPFVIGGVVLIVVATAVISWLDHQKREAAYERGRVLIGASDAGPDALEAALTEIDGPAQAIVKLRLAQLRAEAGDRAGAIEIFTEVADDITVPLRYVELARLEALRLRALDGDLEEVIEALGPLTNPIAVYWPLAMELRASLRLNAGDIEGARSDLVQITEARGITSETRARARALAATLPPAAE